MRRFLLVLIAAVAVFAPAPSGGGTAAPERAFARGENVWTIGADGTRARLLVHSAYSPAWSPDGSRLAFVSRRSNRDQQGEVYVMNANGSGQKRLTRRAGDDWAPDFSRDGARIAFTQLPGTIWVMDADGSGLRKLTAGVDPSWR